MPLIFNYFQIFSTFAELKVVTLHLGGGVISVLWLWELVLKRQFRIRIPIQGLNLSLIQRLGNNPVHWALVGAFIWFSALIMSTLLSPLPGISFFGAENNRSGYNLYDYISFFIIFLSVIPFFRLLHHVSTSNIQQPHQRPTSLWPFYRNSADNP